MDWIKTVKESSFSFLGKLYKGDGFFSYSQSSDLYGKDIHWGLANTVFAAKIYFILKHLDTLEERIRKDIVKFITGFKQKGGIYSDPLVSEKTCVYNKLSAIKNLNFSNFFGRKTKAAETRQAIVALFLLGEKFREPFTAIPYTREGVNSYLAGLNWHDAWGAASHVNHLLFFYKMNADLCGYKKEEAEQLIKYCLEKIDALQNQDNGMWHTREVSAKQKVNAAMKIISGFNIVGRKNIKFAEKIIDFILHVDNEYSYYDGCDNLNVVYVLKNIFECVEKNYRCIEVKSFCEKAIDRYKKYFYPEQGGFSFLPDDKPRKYYGMIVTENFSGPDLHGTMMFAWAVSLAASILDIERDSFQDIIN
ncbi:MAG: hypothetical protein KAS99_01330 [Candidatus Omnitrophica bacterium]|nr:hypothetical protein [Candidatus Omnitrophota bacterium]